MGVCLEPPWRDIFSSLGPLLRCFCVATKKPWFVFTHKRAAAEHFFYGWKSQAGLCLLSKRQPELWVGAAGPTTKTHQLNGTRKLLPTKHDPPVASSGAASAQDRGEKPQLMPVVSIETTAAQTTKPKKYRRVWNIFLHNIHQGWPSGLPQIR